MTKLAAVCAIAAGAAAIVAPALGTPGPPLSMAALGGAASAGACTDGSCADRPQNSWSTGTNPSIDSHRLRLRAVASTIEDSRFRRPIRAFTFATRRFGGVADLDEQVRRAVTRPWRYATVELGDGDLCGGTPVGEFRAELKRALFALSRPSTMDVDGLGSSGRGVLVLSIEDVTRHWAVLRADPVAARALKSGRRLGCGLGYDVKPSRLRQIRQRTVMLNEIIARVCFHTGGCLYDAGTRYRMPLKASYFSPTDPRYVSIEGQRALSAAEWKPARALISAES